MAKQARKEKRSKGAAGGPKYPTRLLKELGQPLELDDRKRRHSRRSGKKADGDAADERVEKDVYEYEEDVPQEESGKNRRFDDVDKLEYELPDDFEDEEIDEDAAFGEENPRKHENRKNEEDEFDDLEQDDDDEEEVDEDVHDKMLEEVSGKTRFKGRRKDDQDSDSAEVDDLEAPITVEDLLAPLQEQPGFNALKKKMRAVQKHAVPVSVPLPKALQEKLDRQVGYEKTREEVSKWQPIVKKNREAATINFVNDVDVTLATTGSMATGFKPSTNLEKEIDALLHESGVCDPVQIETAENLELNKLSVEEVRDRQERLAKMRSLLLRHEERAKRVKKIKSKAYHRMTRKKLKDKPDMLIEDSEQQKEEAMKQEIDRARERMTLKHKNTTRWAKRILKRGIQQYDEGTREAITEQLRKHALLTQKINSAGNGESSSDEDSELDDEPEGLVLEKKPGGKIMAKAKMETLKLLEEGDNEAEIPKTGIFSLPFMVRAIERKRKEAENEAKAVLEELEQAEEEDDNAEQQETLKTGKLSFGAFRKPTTVDNGMDDKDLIERGSDSENSDDETARTKQKPLETKLDLKRKLKPITDSIDGMVEAPGEHTLRVEAPISVDTRKATKKQKTKESSVQNDSVIAANPTIFGNGKLTSSSRGNDIDGMVEAPAEHTLRVDAPISLDATSTGKVKKKKKKQKVIESVDRNNSVIVANPTIFGDGKLTSSCRSSGPDITSGVAIAGRPKKSHKQAEEDAESDENDEPEESGDNDEPEELGDRETNLIAGRSQEDLIREAFAGDDVEAEFEHLKSEAANKEGPQEKIEKDDLPGWGQWTDVQKKRGPPGWLVKQREELEKKREAAKQRRLDAKLKDVIVSEKVDKKASKFMSSSLPFPFTSAEVFENSLRMPLGPDYNTNQAFRELTRPAEIKRAGVIIDPIQYEKPQAKKKRKLPLKQPAPSKASRTKLR